MINYSRYSATGTILSAVRFILIYQFDQMSEINLILSCSPSILTHRTKPD